MYEKVIIPTDGSDCSEAGVEEGLWMAKTLGVEAVAVYVIDISEYEGLHHESIKDSARKGLKNVGKKALKEVRQKAHEIGADIETKLLVGKPFKKITELGEENDIIYISSHGASGFTKLFIGSTTDKVLKNSKCTVAVVKGKYTTED
ncbi:MAG: universal stress protein [Thermoplasmatota archaeon]